MVQRLTETVRSKQSSSSPLLEHTEKLQRELNLLEEERKRFFQAYEDGMISKEELKGHIQGFQRRSEELRTAKDDAERQLNIEKTESVGDDHILAAIRHIRPVLDSADADVRRRFLRLFIDKITLPPDRRIQGAKLYAVGALGIMDLQTMTRQESLAKRKEHTIP